MSEASTTDASHETLSIDHQDLAPPAQSSSIEHVQPDDGTHDLHTDRKLLSPQPDDDGSPSRDGPTHAAPATAKPKVTVSSARRYRQLLNETTAAITQLAPTTDLALAPSQIGGSYWTSFEKETLFRALRTSGPGDLRALSKAVRTKSEAEVQVYLHLLQDGLAEATATGVIRGEDLLETIPAAYEIDAELEGELDIAADTLNWKVGIRDARAESQRHGEGWLVDQHLAESIESLREESEQGHDTPDPDISQAGGPPDKSIASFELLVPEAFLQLSRELFMNPRLGSGDNWAELLSVNDSLEGPAMYRTAFEDFYSLAVTMTRHLVQATLFQTNARLRALDASRTNWQPKVEVQEVDVRTATETLGLGQSWTRYWAKLPRQMGLDVYTDTKKYKDGRSTGKNGVKLTYTEVEAELGMDTVNLEEQGEVVMDDELSASDLDSDDFTDVDESQLHVVRNDISDDEPRKKEEVTDQAATTPEAETRQHRKRKRALSPATFARQEAQYLDALDAKASVEEQRRLWQLLGAKPETDLLAASDPLRRPGLEAGMVQNAMLWRRNVEYESTWEHEERSVPDSAFELIGRLGEYGREKRQRLRARLLADGQDDKDVSHVHAREDNADGSD